MNLRSLGDNIVVSATQTITSNNTFTYDDVGRLTSGTGLYGTRAYTYDKVGNRLSEVRTPISGTAVTQAYAYTANTNRLATVKQGTTTLRAFTYDAAGNITRDTRGTTQYNYNISSAGRIARVAVGTSVRADYVYDGKSRLASRVTQNQAGAGTTRLFHDNDNRVIAEVNAAGTAVREYIWMDDLPVAVLDGTTSTTNPTLFFVHADHLNRPVAMSNAAKAWVWRAQYEPFGAVHQIVGPAANDSRFPGQWFQLEAGLAYNWHRHYDATLGRYTQADPLGLATLLSDGPSVYGYAGQSPLMWVDEDGLSKLRGTSNNLRYSDEVYKKARELYKNDAKRQAQYIQNWLKENPECNPKRREVLRQIIKLLNDGRLRPGIWMPIPTPPVVFCPLVGCNDGPV